MKVYYDTPTVRLTSDSMTITAFNADGSIMSKHEMTPSIEVGAAVPIFPGLNKISIPVFLESVKSNKRKLDNNSTAIIALEQWITDHAN